MAKTKSQEPERAQAGHQADPERWNRLLIIGAVVAVILVAIGFIGFGWYQTQIKPLGKTVLQVGDTKFNLKHLERRMSLMLKDNPSLAQSQQGLRFLSDGVLDQLEREAKLLEAAGELNISVSDEEVAAEIRNRGALAENVEPEIYAAEFAQQVETSGLQASEYQQMLRAGLLDQKVRDYFTYLAPKREPQVRARWIIVDDEDLVEEVIQRLEEGEDFAAVARDVSLDTGSAEQGGELDWRPRGIFTDDIEDFLFEAEPGQRSDVLTAVDLFYIVELLERDEDRELGDGPRQQVVTRNVNDWLQDLDGSLDIERDFTNEDLNRALDDVL